MTICPECHEVVSSMGIEFCERCDAFMCVDCLYAHDEECQMVFEQESFEDGEQ